MAEFSDSIYLQIKSRPFRFSAYLIIVAAIGVPGISPAADNGQGPSMIIAAAEEATQADALVGECKYDDAEHWMKEAAKAAKEARSDNPLERDVAGSVVGQMSVRLDEFRRQRKVWDRAAADARQFLTENRPETARSVIDQAAPPKCDSRFAELRAEIASRNAQARALVGKGDAQAQRYPRTALIYYIEALRIDPDLPGLREKLVDVERRNPGYCTSCTARVSE